jgi:uncharacterized linocin/CFP29 family protein
VRARLRTAQRIVDLRVPFTVSCDAVDSVEWGAKDADWQPVKDAAQTIAYAEDRVVFGGFAEAGIDGIRPASSLSPPALPAEASAYPRAIGDALGKLREAGVVGPYAVLLSKAAYAAAIEAASHGYPVIDHLKQIVDGDIIIWTPPSKAPACCPLAAATTNCTSARTSRSATSATIRPLWSSTSTRR